MGDLDTLSNLNNSQSSTVKNSNSATDLKQSSGSTGNSKNRKPRHELALETGHPPPIKASMLDQEIIAQRRKLAMMKEEPQKCRLLKKERENWDVGRDLEAMRTATRDRLAQCKIKKETFDKRQLELQNIVKSNESFIRDTDIKIERADRKAREEGLACKKADDEYAQLANDLRKLRSEKEAEIDRIRFHMHYKQFLAATAAIYNSQKSSKWPKGENVSLEDKNSNAFITQNRDAT